jgi:hypothetical protein
MSVPSITQHFPFSPEYSTWEDWNGNIVLYFGSEPIGITVDTNWQAGAAQIMNLAPFASYPVSAPESFDNWQDWANSFTQIVNGPSS